MSSGLQRANEFVKLNNTIRRLQDKVESQQKRIAELEKDWDNLDALIDIKDKRIAELEKIIDFDTERFRALGEEIQELKKRIAELGAVLVEVRYHANGVIKIQPIYDIANEALSEGGGE